MQQQMSFQDLEYGRTSPEHSAPQREKTSEPSSKRSAKLKTVTPLYLDLRKANGLTRERSWETGIPSHGECWIANTGAYPNVVEESFLWQILEANVPEKYSLSAKACEGILRRAERRGKELPGLLHFALLLKSGKLLPLGADSSFYRRLCNFAEKNERDAVIAYKPTPAIIASFMGGQGAKAGGIAYSEDLAPTLKSAPSGSNTVPDVVYCCKGVDGYNSTETGDKTSTLGVNCGMSTGRQTVLAVFDARGNGDGSTVPTVTGDHENRVTDYTAVVLACNWDGGQTTPTLTARNAGGCQRMPDKDNFQAVMCFHLLQDPIVSSDVAPCLTQGNDRGEASCGIVALDRAAYNQGANAQFVPGIDGESGKAFTVIAKGPGAVCYAVDCRNARLQEVNGTLQAKPNGGVSYNLNNVVLIPAEIILRRLTPTECARLQGMPDWWCDDIPHSDSAEYKMWGNGMALPCVLYVMEGIKDALSA